MPKRKQARQAVGTSKRARPLAEAQPSADAGAPARLRPDKPVRKARAPVPEPAAESDTSSSDPGDSDASPAASPEAECALEFFDPKERDWASLHSLLLHFLDGSPFHCGELVDAIIAQAGSVKRSCKTWKRPSSQQPADAAVQPSVGTVVKADEDEDAVAVTSVLSTSRHRQQDFMRDIERFLLVQAGPSAAELQQVRPC